MHDFYNFLGARSYYYSEKDTLNTCSTIETCLINSNVDKKEIDPVSVLSVLMKNYVIGSRSLIKGVCRTPWMSKPDGHGGWLTSDLPPHGSDKIGPEDASKKLYSSLRDEALAFVEGKKTIGILLSGGMDSRIVAGVVRQLQLDKLFVGDVVALTWGLPDSRDMIYAQRIAKAFGWGFKDFVLDSSGLARNIVLAAERGAEYSPVHLHAMESVSLTEGLDGVLAGSYGDSIGRGEYSGRGVNALPNILDKHFNHFAFMLQSAKTQSLVKIKNDLLSSRKFFPDRSELSYRELEMQMHYMRRQLNSCMEVIDDKIPFYQMFGSPNSFGLMWSLAADCRNDDVYEHLLLLLPNVLRDIPWARTGKKYNQHNLAQEDTYSSLNNSYGNWLRGDLREYVLDLINNGELQKLGIFNGSSLSLWSKQWPKTSVHKADRLDEKMAWLASLSLFVKKYNVQAPNIKYEYSIADFIELRRAYVHTCFYHLALKIRK